jgi:RNA polymerase sigma-70 factor (ECF subfamily)
LFRVINTNELTVVISMPTTSPSLLHRLKDDSANSLAWSRFTHIYTPLLMRWVMRMGMRHDEAVDIVQEVMLALMVRLPSFQYDANSSFRAWLRTVTRNKTRDYLRRNEVRRRHETLKKLESTDEASAVFTDAEFHQALSRRALEIMKQEFEETTWRACWEATVEARKADDIAAELGISVNAVYLAKGRVLRRLRQEMEGMY